MKWHLSHRNQFFENGQKSQGQTSRLVELNLNKQRLKSLDFLLSQLELWYLTHSPQAPTVAALAWGSAERGDTINQNSLCFCKLVLKATRLSPEINTKQKKIQYNWH